MACLRSLEVERCLQLVSCLTVARIMKMVSLEELIVGECPKIGSVQIERQQVQQEEVKDEVSFPGKLKQVELNNCGDQVMELLVGGMMILDAECVLERLEIISCDSLRRLAITSRRGGNKVKWMEIVGCKNLVSLSNVLDERTAKRVKEDAQDLFRTNIVEIERLDIRDCPSLRTGGMKSLVAVKNLSLWGITFDEDMPSTIAESVVLQRCTNLNSLPHWLHHLTNLRRLKLSGCDGLECFPEDGLPIPNLTSLTILDCENLKSLPKNMHNLTLLEELRVIQCPSLKSFPEEGGLPPKLIDLWIIDCPNVRQPMSQWGLHTLASLQTLWIGGDAVLKDEEKLAAASSSNNTSMLLPSTLTSLRISDMKNLESISSSSCCSSKCLQLQVQNLTSLRRLYIWDCPKLRYLPKEGLPQTLELLEIMGCPILEDKCSEGKGKYWPLISLIPRLRIE